MKIAAITTYPPSAKPLSSFAFNAVQGFLTFPEVSEIIVLADETESVGRNSTNGKLSVLRCWQYNSPSNTIRLVKALDQYKPDIVWLNLQYSLFGNQALPAFLGLLSPAWFKQRGYPLVTMLHNFIGGVSQDLTYSSVNKNLSPLVSLADKVAMRSIIASDKIFVMVQDYQEEITKHYPCSNTEFIEQDLFPTPEYLLTNEAQHQIATMGYFGTYKKLETLIEAFATVREEIPSAKLQIAGRSSMFSPSYLEGLFDRYANNLEGIEFLGYLDDKDVPQLFLNSNAVVITNSDCAGSSGPVRLAAAHGRPIIAPDIKCLNSLDIEGWAIRFYPLNNAEELAKTIIDLLNSHKLQNTLGYQNFQRWNRSGGQWLKAHRKTFNSFYQAKK